MEEALEFFSEKTQRFWWSRLFAVYLAVNPKSYSEKEKIDLKKSIKSTNFAGKTATIYQTDFEVQIPPLFTPSSSKVVDTRTLWSFTIHSDYDTKQEFNSVELVQINLVKDVIKDLQQMAKGTSLESWADMVLTSTGFFAKGLFLWITDGNISLNRQMGGGSERKKIPLAIWWLPIIWSVINHFEL